MFFVGFTVCIPTTHINEGMRVMKRTTVIVLGLVLCAVPLFAQGGMIAIFADPGGTDCAIYDTQANKIVQVYVVHMFAPEANCAQFSVPVPECAFGLTWLSDDYVFPINVGESPTGIALCRGVCYSSPFHILTINYWGMGTSLDCCVLTVEPDPREVPPVLIMTDCNHDIHTAIGGSAIINPDETCPCLNVPLEETTWGRVKAMYLE